MAPPDKFGKITLFKCKETIIARHLLKIFIYGVLASGETLQDERTKGGMFVGTDGHQFPQKTMPVSCKSGKKYSPCLKNFISLCSS